MGARHLGAPLRLRTRLLEAGGCRRGPRLTQRLLFLNQYFPPDEAATAQLLGDLVERAAREFDCRVVTSNRGYAEPERTYPCREDWGGARIERVRMTGFGRSSKAGRVVDYLSFLVGASRRLLAGERPDVIVGLASPPVAGALAVVAARLRGVRSVYWAMDVHPDVAFALGLVSPRGLLGRFLSMSSRWTLRSADLVIALGEVMRERLEAQGARRVEVVHNWADEGIDPGGGKALRIERGWEGRFVVLYSGNLGLAHEFDTILGAAARLSGNPGILFAFAGAGPRRSEVEKRVLRTAVRNVEFLPPVPRRHLGARLAAADLHVVSLRPGMAGLLVPSKIYGILASGRPALYVGPEAGEVFEIVRSGCGSAVRTGDADSLARVIIGYSSDPSRCDREGRAARALFEARFTKHAQTTRLCTLLGDVVGAPHAGRE